MLGQIVYRAGRNDGGRLEEARVCGLSVLRFGIDPEGYWAHRRLKRAGRMLAREGVRRVLVPEGFEEWDTLKKYGLRSVDPLAFLRARAAPISVAALKKEGRAPEKCAVALRGVRADRAAIQTAEELCAQVRDVCVSFPCGGEALREQLRWDYGVAARPDFPSVAAAVRFDPRTWDQGGAVLDLFGPEVSLGGVTVAVTGLSQEGTQGLPLIAALWEAGRVEPGDLEFT